MKEVFTDTETTSEAANTQIIKREDGTWSLHIFFFPFVWEFVKSYKTRKAAKIAAQNMDRSIKPMK